MKSLLLLRHAKSSWKDLNLDDHDRPLNKRGKRNAPRMGRLMKEKGLLPDLIITSTAKRARKTAVKAARAADFQGEIIQAAKLYHAEPEEMLQVLGTLGRGPASVMLVGHNPGMEELLNMLHGRDEEMPTGALAHLEAKLDDWNELYSAARDGLSERAALMELKGFWKPRELPED